MLFADFRYLWPPRPDSKQAVMPNMLGYYERQGWIGQIKKNGTCNVIAVSPEGKIVAMNRHNEQHKLWSPTEKSSAAFKGLPGTGWYVFVAELLHSKVTDGPRDTNYIFDILVADGKYLVGKTFEERQTILLGLFEATGETDSHYIITDHTWVAKPFRVGFADRYRGLSAAEDEGIVLKDPRARLELCAKATANTRWAVKCRREHKNFRY